MAKMNALLSQRLKSAGEKLSKMTSLVEMSSSGNLSSFSGVFRILPLSENEESTLNSLLEEYRTEEQEIGDDLRSLSTITAEVKAINNQAILLHGERIKRAQEILKRYRDGAFSAWLIATYGNRQTPYNFLQYYELQLALPQELQPKLDEMPKQVVYSLASRRGELEEKERIIKNYKGEPKAELLDLIRKTFPLAEEDKRAKNGCDALIQALHRLHAQAKRMKLSPTPKQKAYFLSLLRELESLWE